jgi:hypothetical protein
MEKEPIRVLVARLAERALECPAVTVARPFFEAAHQHLQTVDPDDHSASEAIAAMITNEQDADRRKVFVDTMVAMSTAVSAFEANEIDLAAARVIDESTFDRWERALLFLVEVSQRAGLPTQADLDFAKGIATGVESWR